MADEVKETTTESTDTTTDSTSTSSRTDEINKMYDANITARTAALESERDTALSEAQASRDKIATSYDAQRNSIAAEYERQRRNNNLNAQANGLNTGALSQQTMSNSAEYQQNQTELSKSQVEEETEADRNMDTIKNEYASQIQEAASDNDFNRMSALYEESTRMEEQERNDAKTRANLGDFSGYEVLFGTEIANTMKKVWSLQNPETAYNLGYITADEYFKQTGQNAR